MEETKKCPYCGEEIKIDAKKCKHCNEWLEGMLDSSTREDDGECGILPEEPNYILLTIACWVTMFFAILSCIQELGTTSGGGGGLLVGIAKIIPAWIVMLCDGLLFIYLIMGLRRHCSRIQSSIKIPFNKFIYFLAISNFILIIDEIFGFLDSEDEFGFLILYLIIACYYIYIHLIVGAKLRNVLSSDKSVGLWFILWTIAQILLAFVLSILSLSNYDEWYALGSSLVYIVLLYRLKIFFNANIDENW